ncbi:MAG: glycoside hydrolase family 18 [Bacteroides sp.]|nr:glycoside hydrolase family 18 [Bacteroides sp.]
MKNIIKPFAGLFLLGTVSLASCTDVESITIHESSVNEQNPEAYAKYLSNLNAYKSADHKVVYAFFDNSNKTPYSPAQHITNMPDSIDVISMMYPALEEFEKTDIEAVHQKGTKVVYTVSYDDIEAAYDELTADGSTSVGTFDSYLQSELTTQMAYAGDFDGLIFEFSGENPNFMSATDLAAYQTTQNIFLSAISSWQSANTGKMLVFKGEPQNLLSRTLLSNCEHIILDCGSATTSAQLDLLVTSAMETGVPTDRFVMAVSTVSTDSADRSTGYWDSSRALSEVAYWTTVENASFEKAGIAIYNVQNDYYSTAGACTYVREAIDIMNPAPVK